MSIKESRSQCNAQQGNLHTRELSKSQRPVDRDHFEKLIEMLPPDQKQLAEESARIADFCQYFAEQRIDLPAEVLERIGDLHTLALEDRIQRVAELNSVLMEHLRKLGQCPGGANGTTSRVTITPGSGQHADDQQESG